jgi:hypothetical protein
MLQWGRDDGLRRVWAILRVGRQSGRLVVSTAEQRHKGTAGLVGLVHSFGGLGVGETHGLAGRGLGDRAAGSRRGTRRLWAWAG